MKADAEAMALELNELRAEEEQAFERTQMDWVEELHYEEWLAAMSEG